MIRIGLIGCGFISKKHIETIAQHEGFQLTAVSDIHPHKMDEAVQQYHHHKQSVTIAKYKDYQLLLKDQKVDVVLIATISGLHAQIAKQALYAGKHTIIEKPMALSLTESRALLLIAKQKKRRIFVCHQLRYLPLLEKVNALIQKGTFGKIYYGSVTIRLNRSSDYYDQAKWKGSWDQDGGMLLNQGIHLIDLLIWMVGDVSAVYGEMASYLDVKDKEDVFTGILSFKNGAKGIVEANTISKPRNIGYHLAIFGEKGSLVMGGKSIKHVQHCHVDGEPNILHQLRTIEKKKVNERSLMYDDIYRSLTMNHQGKLTGEASHKALEVIFAMYQSTQKNARIRLPITEFTTKNMGKRRSDK